jgi:hypothetical protein
MEHLNESMPSPDTKVLISYGTRYGATAGTSEVIASSVLTPSSHSQIKSEKSASPTQSATEIGTGIRARAARIVGVLFIAYTVSSLSRIVDAGLHDPLMNWWATLLMYMFALLTLIFTFKIYRETNLSRAHVPQSPRASGAHSPS